MSGGFDLYTLIFLVLAVFLFFKLRSVLGTKTGSEKDTLHRQVPPPPPVGGPGNVVQMPVRENGPVIDATPAAPRWGDAPPTLARGFDAIAGLDAAFDPTVFTQGARQAYEMIVTAFARGDRAALNPLLSPEVFAGFESAIKDRETRSEAVETRFIGLDKAEIIGAETRDTVAYVTMKFVCQLVTVTRDKAGVVVDGSPDKVQSVTDLWTFARDTRDRNPNWKLVGTESGS
jgi:predicted lipid-binding transport protein (Tim44 family)